MRNWPTPKDMTGRRFGRLVVTRMAGHYVAPSGCRSRLWLCKCECGAEIETIGTRLRAGRANSCGKCIHKDRESPRLRHGHARKGAASAEYRCWSNIKRRCYDKTNKSFKDYGERGITVWGGWVDDFDAFYAHVGAKPGPSYSLDRIDNEKGYEPGNVRWATRSQQSTNTRKTVRITANKETLSATEWARRLGCSPDTIYERLKRGWSPERAVTEPIRR